MENCDLIWENKIIGAFTNIEMDMWYLDGKLSLNKTDKSKKFKKALLKLDSKGIFLNLNLGLKALLRPNKNSELNIIVISLDEENNFLVRTV
ncbi:MAG: hypothetical protein WBF67_09480 [Olleya sp.]